MTPSLPSRFQVDNEDYVNMPGLPSPASAQPIVSAGSCPVVKFLADLLPTQTVLTRPQDSSLRYRQYGPAQLFRHGQDGRSPADSQPRSISIADVTW